MSTNSILFYYPSTVNFWASTVAWNAGAIIAAVLVILILILTRKTPIYVRSMIALCGIACVFATFAILRTYPPQTWASPVFAPGNMLKTLWQKYKNDYIDSSGRTIDDGTRDQTTSEAEGYTMLRAVWMDDKPTFDAGWQWTQANLQRKDHLFSWLYGKTASGTEGVLTDQNGNNSASDADTDIALALVFAYSRWQNPAYLTAALPVVKSIWKEEVFYANGNPYLGPDNLVASSSAQYKLLNPSYFSPYAYRIFSFLDPHDNWQGLIDASYQILADSIRDPLNVSTTADLPPDWMQIDTTTGALLATPSSQTTEFGYDALRVPWRIALDWKWYGDPRASSTLALMGFLSDQWKQYRFLDGVYNHDGSPAAYYQSPAMYGGAIGYFLVADPSDAVAVYRQKLEYLYNPDTETWKSPLDYYDANIAWFGIALYNNALPNLFDLNLPTSTTS